jgi:hypothetical protein
MWYRYQGYVEGREPLAAMAYFCLTVLTSTTGGLPGACQTYGIYLPLLKELAALTSPQGGVAARTMQRLKGHDYTQAERKWIDRVVRALIRRAGDYAANPSRAFPLIDFNRFPRP